MSGRGGDSAVPYLPEVRIERDAVVLAEQFAQVRGVPMAAPVPVDDILEQHLGLTFEIEDLTTVTVSRTRRADDAQTVTMKNTKVNPPLVEGLA